MIRVKRVDIPSVSVLLIFVMIVTAVDVIVVVGSVYVQTLSVSHEKHLAILCCTETGVPATYHIGCNRVDVNEGGVMLVDGYDLFELAGTFADPAAATRNHLGCRRKRSSSSEGGVN